MILAERLQHHDAFAAGHDHAGEADHLLFLYGVTDHRKGFLPDLIGRLSTF
jgi:hypothetical protein